jgi:membrane protease YdiL (CAAX protease family)
MTTGKLQQHRAAIHGGLFFAIYIIATAVLPLLAWPWFLVLPVFVYGGIVSIVGPLWRTAPRLSIGGMGGRPLASAAGVALATSCVLVGFQTAIHPDVKSLAAKLPANWFGNLLLAGICFSVVNAVMEEIIFRGLLWELVSEEWNKGTALGVTAVLFGLCHLQGYPPGPIGALMAAMYGVALGALRWWTGGLGLPIACHVCADATIFYILALTVA